MYGIENDTIEILKIWAYNEKKHAAVLVRFKTYLTDDEIDKIMDEIKQYFHDVVAV